MNQKDEQAQGSELSDQLGATRIGKGTRRIIELDLLGAIAGALAASGNAPNTLRRVRELIENDGLSDA